GCPGEMASGNCSDTTDIDPTTGRPIVTQPTAAIDRFAATVPGYQAVLLMEGANDIDHTNPNTTSPGLAGLTSMLSIANRIGLKPFLASIPPEVPTFTYGGINPQAVRNFNAQVRTLALTTQGVTLVDVEAAFGSSPAPFLSCDGLHPNSAGYQLIADTFFNI